MVLEAEADEVVRTSVIRPSQVDDESSTSNLAAISR